MMENASQPLPPAGPAPRRRAWLNHSFAAGGAYLLAGAACPCCGRPACATGLGVTAAAGSLWMLAALLPALARRLAHRVKTPGRIVSALLLALAALAAGCGRPDAPEEKAGRPVVVTTFFPVHEFTRVLAGEDFTVRCLVPPGGDPHAMEATPGLAREVAGARLLVLLGLGMDDWAAKLAAGSQTKTVRLGEGLPVRPVGPAELAAPADDGAAHDGGETDPHVWLDPLLARDMVRRLADELAEAFPEHAAAVRERAARYDAELSALDAEFAEGIAGCARREVVTFHGAFAYLFARYELRTLGVVELFPGHEPSAAYLRGLVDVMRRARLEVIFAEPQLPDRAARVIAAEIGGRVERLDPCETILPDEPAATYLGRQRRNLATLRRVLGAESSSQ